MCSSARKPSQRLLLLISYPLGLSVLLGGCASNYSESIVAAKTEPIETSNPAQTSQPAVPPPNAVREPTTGDQQKRSGNGANSQETNLQEVIGSWSVDKDQSSAPNWWLSSEVSPKRSPLGVTGAPNLEFRISFIEDGTFTERLEVKKDIFDVDGRWEKRGQYLELTETNSLQNGRTVPLSDVPTKMFLSRDASGGSPRLEIDLGEVHVVLTKK